MKSVLMIAYFFPPDGCAGAYRPLRFVRHLPPLGWQATVIASDGHSYERYDPGLLALVPRETMVIRVRGRDPWQALQARRGQHLQETLAQSSLATVARIQTAHQAPLRSWLRTAVRTVESWCYHPDLAMGWIRPAVHAIGGLCSRERPNVIWATGGPWSSFLVAHRASQRTGVPYVMDFRDSWTVTYDDFEARRPAWARRLDRRLLHRLFKGAQAVIFRYHSEAECYWQAYPGALEADRVHIIPNGYEGTIEQFVPPDGEKCTLLYTGTLSTYRYDTLLQGLVRLKETEPACAKGLRLLFVGEATEALENQASRLGVSDLVATSGPTSYAEIQRLQSQAHALLVLGRPPTIRGYELFAGAKLFGYLKAARPIIGVLPSDETKKILTRVGVSTVADVDSPLEIVSVLRQLLEAWSTGTLSTLLPNREACAAYSAAHQTAALVRALEGAPAAEPFMPGLIEMPPSIRREFSQARWATTTSM